MSHKTIHAHIYGRVQGVFFRDYTQRKATELGLNGWVRNCADGSVEAVIDGADSRVDEMIVWLHQGSPHSDVRQVTTEEIARDTVLSDFRTIY